MALLRNPRLLLAVAATLSSGGLLYLAMSLNPLFWAAWIAPIPLLYVALRVSDRQARGMAVIAALIGNIGPAVYLWQGLGSPVPALIIVAVSAFLWQFVIGVTRRCVLRSQHVMICFLYPALWAAVDTIIANVSPHGTGGSMAYSQMTALPVIQIAALAGTAGIVFLINILPSVIAIALYRKRDIARPLVSYGLPLAVAVAALLYGTVRLQTANSGPTIAVGLAVDNAATNFSNAPDAVQTTIDRYGKAVTALAGQGATIVVLPEEIAYLPPAGEAAARDALAKIAADAHVDLLAGVNVSRGEHQENQAWLFDATGHSIADYAKQHLLPGLESPRIVPGHRDIAVQIGPHRLGIAICKDMDFASLGRAYSKLGVDAMLVPAWDFDIDGWAHARPAHLRGVEGGYSVFRTARHGLLTVTDPYGRVVAAEASSNDAAVDFVATVPLAKGGATFYARFGDWFGWGCALAGAVVILAPLVRRLIRRPH